MKTFTFLAALAAVVQTTSALPPRELAPAGTFDTILKYVYFIGASLQHPCAKPPFGAVTVQDFSIQPSDTQASIYRLDSNKELILAFPPSVNITDFVTDFSVALVPYSGCSGCFVHIGFYSSFNSIAAALNTTLAAQVQQYPSYTVTITGGSLGGALAKLAFNYFKSQPLFQNKVTAGWSIGEPRVGNAAFATYTDQLSGATDSNVGLYRRVTHANDIVPQAPPTSLGYQHSRTELWEMNNAQGVPDAAHLYRCYGQEPTDCVNGQGSVDVNAHLTYAGANATVCN